MGTPLALTDAQVIDAFYAAGIPAAFHAKDKGMQTLQIAGCDDPAAALAWVNSGDVAGAIANGDCITIDYDGADGNQFVYRFARTLLLHGHAVKALGLPDIVRAIRRRFDGTDGMNAFEDLRDSSVLIIMQAAGCSLEFPWGEEARAEVENVLRRWVQEGTLLVWQGEVPFLQCEWWSLPFRRMIGKRVVLSFAGPPHERAAPMKRRENVRPL